MQLGARDSALRVPRWIGGIYSPGQGIWGNIEKSSEAGQERKSLITTFACFLTAIAKS